MNPTPAWVNLPKMSDGPDESLLLRLVRDRLGVPEPLLNQVRRMADAAGRPLSDLVVDMGLASPEQLVALAGFSDADPDLLPALPPPRRLRPVSAPLPAIRREAELGPALVAEPELEEDPAPAGSAEMAPILVAQLERDAAQLLQIYRDANLASRGEEGPPSYWGKRFQLGKDLKEPVVFQELPSIEVKDAERAAEIARGKIDAYAPRFLSVYRTIDRLSDSELEGFAAEELLAAAELEGEE